MQPLTQPHPTTEGGVGARCPWVPVHSLEGNGSWHHSQSSSYLEQRMLSGHCLGPPTMSPDQGASYLRPQEVVSG
jgi:hypothetical protein